MKTAVILALISFGFTACEREQGKSEAKEARGQDSSTEGVSTCFLSYRSAILDQNGEKAVKLLSQATIDEYQSYVDLALAAERQALEELSFINRMQVLILRHRIPVEVLRTLDGRSAIVHAVDRDWIGKDGVIRTELGKISIASRRATAEVEIGGRKVPSRFQFRQEDGAWKFDLVSLLRDTNLAMKQAARQAGMEEDEFLFTILESVSGKKVDDGIWTPPN